MVEKLDSWTVLIVDDDEDNLSVLQQLMEFLDVKCYCAREGLEALNLLADLPITLVLLDLSMPTLDGWEMLKRLRATDTKSKLPVIAVTAHAMAGDKEKAIESGFNGYITKPFLFSDLLLEMKRCAAVPSKEGATSS